MTEKLKKEIEDCKTLDELFKLWKQAHKGEENFFKTFPKCSCCGGVPNENFKESFCKDGITSLNGNVNKDKTITEDVKVLFVLKESNCGGHKVNDKFWFDENTEGDETRKKYAEKLASVFENIRKSVDFEYKFGYMNLNKRGGYGSTNRKQLEAYTLEYYTFIKKEIEILSPDYIIFCGCFDAFVKACKEKDNQCLHKWNRKNPQKQKYNINKNKHANIVNIYHPANRQNDFKNSLEILKTLNYNK